MAREVVATALDNLEVCVDSLKKVTVKHGQVLARGELVMLLPEAAAAVAGTNTGNGTVGIVTAGKFAEVGTYTLTATAATKFAVVTPSGDLLKELTTGAAYATDHIGLTITAGVVAFVAGDSFTVAVTKSKIAAHTEGFAPYSVMQAAADATNADVEGTVYREAELKGSEVILGANVTLAQVKDALDALDIHLV